MSGRMKKMNEHLRKTRKGYANLDYDKPKKKGLMVNNPEGFNKHKKSKKKKRAVVKKEVEVVIEEQLTKEDIVKAYRAKRVAYAEYLSESRKYADKLKKFVGIDFKKIDKEVLEMYKRKMLE